VNLKVLDAVKGEVRASWSGVAESDEALLARLNEGAASLAEQLVEAAVAGPARSKVGWIPFGAGVVAAGVGAAFLSFAAGKHASLTSAASPLGPSLTATQARALATAGAREQTAGWLCAGLGAAAVATGAALLLVGPHASVQGSAVLTPNGGQLWVGVAF
jgi:hypothetical protein